MWTLYIMLGLIVIVSILKRKLVKLLLIKLWIATIYEWYSQIILWSENLFDQEYNRILLAYADEQIAWECRKYRPSERFFSEKEWCRRKKARKVAHKSRMFNFLWR